MTKIVVSYTNPDLDGVACSIAIEALEQPAWRARLQGDLDAETEVVLRQLGLAIPSPVGTWNSVDAIWLVDTHHVKQLPPGFPTDKVLRITDHHPAGDAGSFEHATIQNEQVGAAATLVSELFADTSVSMPPAIAVLLQAAIVSNTLDFRAASTSGRDREAFQKLQGIRPAVDTLFHDMREARLSKLRMTTDDIVRSDTKVFNTAFGPVVVGQLESPGAMILLDRPDLRQSLISLSHDLQCVAAVMNLVDTDTGESAVLATDPRIDALLCKVFQVDAKSNQVIRVKRLLQRKTDIVPHLTSPNES